MNYFSSLVLFATAAPTTHFNPLRLFPDSYSTFCCFPTVHWGFRGRLVVSFS